MFKLTYDIKNSSYESDKAGHSSIFKTKIESLSCKTISHFKELVGDFPKPNEMFFLFTVKQFNAFSIINAAIKTFGHVDKLDVSSYNVSRRVVAGLSELIIDNKVLSLDIYVSDVAKSMFPKSFDTLNEVNASHQNINVHYAWNHSKIALIKCQDNYFICEGSGNFSNNARHEQYILTNSKEIYEFRRKNLADMVGK